MLAASLALAALLGCRADPGRQPDAANLAPPVEAVPARSGALPLTERLNGRWRLGGRRPAPEEDRAESA